MAELPPDVQVIFDAESASGTSDSSTDESTNTNRDWHQEQYPAYQPPHRRGHNVQQDKFVNARNDKQWEKDQVQGVENEKYQRLKINIPYALEKLTLSVLRGQFPGMYFHCSDNGNHDHPFSHAVTMVGTRLMQRKIKPGSRILDVYGNPNACDSFNRSQSNAPNPKSMKALVNRNGPNDFIREVNKWGPYFDDEAGVERYHRGPLMSMVNDGTIAEYDVLHFTHTMYYVPMAEIAAALHAPHRDGKKRVAYALIHRHSNQRGTINQGEQRYEKKVVGETTLLKQTNVATLSQYVHPDLTEKLFVPDKTWLPPFRGSFVDPVSGLRVADDAGNGLGLAWELHKVNDETWIVEMVPYVDVVCPGVVNYTDLWNDDTVFDDDFMSDSPTAARSVSSTSTGVMIPTSDGKFIECEIPDIRLFDHLRASCVGKTRNAKLIEELVSKANHLVNPSALFGDRVSQYTCPPEKIYDVCVAAYMHGVNRESEINSAIANMRPVLNNHAHKLRLGPKISEFSLGDLMQGFRMMLSVAKGVNSVVRSKDTIGAGLDMAEAYLA